MSEGRGPVSALTEPTEPALSTSISNRSTPLPFPGSEAILAAILAGGTPALPGGE